MKKLGLGEEISEDMRKERILGEEGDMSSLMVCAGGKGGVGV